MSKLAENCHGTDRGKPPGILKMEASRRGHPVAIGAVLFAILLVHGVCQADAQCLTENEASPKDEDVSKTMKTVVDGSLQFGLKLFSTLQSTGATSTTGGDGTSRGLFFSPFSIWSALVVTLMGARGRTEKELAATLGVSESDKTAVARAYNSVKYWYQVREKQLENGSATFRVANRLYFQEDAPIRQCMLEYFGADMGRLNFRTDPESSRQAVNEWVESVTENKIKDLLPPASVASDTRLVIANAVYFLGTWKQSFDPQNTRPRRFTVSRTEEVYLDMMNTRGTFVVGESAELGCWALELPYTGRDLSMVILLPRNRYYGLDALSRKLDAKSLNALLDEMYPAELLVSLPKFRLEDGFDATEVLRKLGIKDLFDPERSDLSGFTGENDLAVNTVRHKAYVNVNEEGTEAAGATAVLASRTARPAGPSAFIADRPFFFFIRDSNVNTVLFMGTVEKPVYK